MSLVRKGNYKPYQVN
jgi:hypothetical protein